MSTELVSQIALTQIPTIGRIQARILLNHLGTAAAVFKTKQSELEKIEGIGSFRAKSIVTFTDFSGAEKEIRFIERYGIQTLFLGDGNYPTRLMNCYDPPILLYYRGNTSLNKDKIISVIGTRNNSEYGRSFTEKFIRELAPYDVFVVSGLAFGIDAIAHRSALKQGLSTIAVLGHGLNTIYPNQHITLAKEILHNGGLLTEFGIGNNPERFNFPLRNRIVAGISDATIVIETGIKGGSIITANLANGYNRDVFAVPGRASDVKSSGCNQLIQSNKAMLLSSAAQLLEVMSWSDQRLPVHETAAIQASLFLECSDQEKIIIKTIRQSQPMHINQVTSLAGFSRSSVVSTLLDLELKNIIRSLPGNLFQLNA